jgi:hypothetical protein
MQCCCHPPARLCDGRRGVCRESVPDYKHTPSSRACSRNTDGKPTFRRRTERRKELRRWLRGYAALEPSKRAPGNNRPSRSWEGRRPRGRKNQISSQSARLRLRYRRAQHAQAAVEPDPFGAVFVLLDGRQIAVASSNLPLGAQEGTGARGTPMGSTPAAVATRARQSHESCDHGAGRRLLRKRK